MSQLPKIGNYVQIIILMGRNTSVSLGEHFEDFVDSSVTNGRFKNASEVIRAGLRLLEEEEMKAAALRTTIEEGIASGIAVDFNAKTHLADLKSRRTKLG